jgi:phenylalanyl-tRNA synthetase beta chain
MHPGRCAVITINGAEAGYFGEVHPAVCANYEIETKVFIAVLTVDALISNAVLMRTYKPLPKFPGIKRDIAVLVKSEVTAGEIEAAIREKAGKILEEVNLFDVYTGEQIEEGFKSVAYSLLFLSRDKTLTEEEAQTAIERILKNLETKIGAKLR